MKSWHYARNTWGIAKSYRGKLQVTARSACACGRALPSLALAGPRGIRLPAGLEVGLELPGLPIHAARELHAARQKPCNGNDSAQEDEPWSVLRMLPRRRFYLRTPAIASQMPPMFFSFMAATQMRPLSTM